MPKWGESESSVRNLEGGKDVPTERKNMNVKIEYYRPSIFSSSPYEGPRMRSRPRLRFKPKLLKKEDQEIVNLHPTPECSKTISAGNPVDYLFSTQNNSDFEAKDAYVESIRKKFLQNKAKEGFLGGKDIVSGNEEDIRRRLEVHGHANMQTMTCMYDMCGRSFESLEVLAFHISYAHQDISNDTLNHIQCLLCGRTWPTVKSKLVHLSKHRIIGLLHNYECINQAGPVIAPNAPKALRLMREKHYLKMCEFDEMIEDDVDIEEPVEFLL